MEDMDDLIEISRHEEEMEDEDNEGEDSDAEMQSVGVELNERLRAAVALREAGNTAVMDEEWEQWLKDAVEAGGLPYYSSDLGLSPNANIPGTRPASDRSGPTMHPRLLNAARLGQWQQIPDVLHTLVRQEMEASRDDLPPSAPMRTRTTAARMPFQSEDHMTRFARRPVPIPTDPSSYLTQARARSTHLRGGRP